MLQHCSGGGKRERVAYKSTGEESDAGGRIRVIAILPEPAIESIHERGLAGQDANRHATADHLAVSDEIGADAKQGLRAARMDAETRDDFIEDECGPGFCCQLAAASKNCPGRKSGRRLCTGSTITAANSWMCCSSQAELLFVP